MLHSDRQCFRLWLARLLEGEHELIARRAGVVRARRARQGRQLNIRTSVLILGSLATFLVSVEGEAASDAAALLAAIPGQD